MQGTEVMFAYIPARSGSKRIPGKNMKSLGGKPVLFHVIDQLMESKELQGIAVSTDCADMAKKIKSYCSKVETLELRAKHLADDHATFMDLIKHDLPRFESFFSTHDVLFTLPTAALVKSKFYRKALEEFYANDKNLVISVSSYEHHPLLALSGSKYLKPLFPDKYALPTKELSPCFIDAGCFYLFNSKQAKSYNMLVEMPQISFIELPQTIGIDVDTLNDWQVLENSFSNLNC